MFKFSQVEIIWILNFKTEMSLSILKALKTRH